MTMNRIIIVFAIFIIFLLVFWDLTNFPLSRIGQTYNLQKLDYHNMSLYLSGIITGLITFFAMWLIDLQNKKRWERDAVIKAINDQRIDFYKKLTKAIDDSCSYFQNIINEESQKELPELFHYLKEEIEHYSEIYEYLIKKKEIKLNDIEEEFKHLHLYFSDINNPSEKHYWNTVENTCKFNTKDDVLNSINKIKECRSILAKNFLKY